ncbi:hypothetical protein AURDEDRAFT_127491 [Auricularia subglabra TFB-10046 SS5]|nr:hypothetical protein AURDEDRAFT_127491 [Auricularia subglabra TFB-10046 SS5]
MATTFAPTPSQENIGGDRPELQHRNSSTTHVPEQHSDVQIGTSQHSATEPSQLATPSPSPLKPQTVPRASHRGAGHGESKPAPSDGHGAHPGTAKVDLDGPPQPDWDKAEAERKERAAQAERAKQEGRGAEQYPEQLHAGEVGLGPAFADHTRATFGDKVKGFKEVLRSKVKHDPELAQAGHDRMTGETKRREFQHQNEADPFKNADDKQPNAPKTEDAPAQAGSAPPAKPSQEPANVPTERAQPPAGENRDVGFHGV